MRDADARTSCWVLWHATVDDARRILAAAESEPDGAASPVTRT